MLSDTARNGLIATSSAAGVVLVATMIALTLTRDSSVQELESIFVVVDLDSLHHHSGFVMASGDLPSRICAHCGPDPAIVLEHSRTLSGARSMIFFWC